MLYQSEGLEPPFTTLHYPSPKCSRRLQDGVLQNRNLLINEICDKITKKNISEDENRWRVVKGGEGSEQPFTILIHWYCGNYTRKVKGEGFSRIFFCIDCLRHGGNYFYNFWVCRPKPLDVRQKVYDVHPKPSDKQQKPSDEDCKGKSFASWQLTNSWWVNKLTSYMTCSSSPFIISLWIRL